MVNVARDAAHQGGSDITKLTILFAAAAVFLCGPAPVQADHGGVHVFYPPAREKPAEPPKKARIVKQAVAVAVIQVEARPLRHRHRLHWRWTGFGREYSGPRYPF